MSSSPERHTHLRRGWAAMTIVLSLEAFGGLALLVPAVLGLMQTTAEPLGQRASIFLAVLVSWIWVCATLFGVRSRASWVRASAITIHVLIFAAGTGILQLGIASATIGWWLVVLALVGFFAALIARPILPDLATDEEPEAHSS